MDLPFRIEKRDSFRVVGSLIETTNKKGRGRKDIPMHWSKFKEDNLKRHCWICQIRSRADCLASIFIILIKQIPESFIT